MVKGTDRGDFPELTKSLFIVDTPGHKEEVRREFAAEGPVLKFVSEGLVPMGLSRPSGRVRSIGETLNGGMGPRG